MLVIFLVALTARMAVVVWGSGRFPAVEDGHYYDVLARRIAGGAGYTWLWPDGAVTYVAHYPVGYPAIVAAGYALLGATTGIAMTLNALVGAAGRLRRLPSRRRRRRRAMAPGRRGGAPWPSTRRSCRTRRR